jgi:hypothetical protein
MVVLIVATVRQGRLIPQLEELVKLETPTSVPTLMAHSAKALAKVPALIGIISLQKAFALEGVRTSVVVDGIPLTVQHGIQVTVHPGIH